MIHHVIIDLTLCGSLTSGTKWCLLFFFLPASAHFLPSSSCYFFFLNNMASVISVSWKVSWMHSDTVTAHAVSFHLMILFFSRVNCLFPFGFFHSLTMNSCSNLDIEL